MARKSAAPSRTTGPPPVPRFWGPSETAMAACKSPCHTCVEVMWQLRTSHSGPNSSPPQTLLGLLSCIHILYLFSMRLYPKRLTSEANSTLQMYNCQEVEYAQVQLSWLSFKHMARYKQNYSEGYASTKEGNNLIRLRLYFC